MTECESNWVAGWNIPGFLPDEEAAYFPTFEEAAAYIVDELERADEDLGEEQGTSGQYQAAIETLNAMRGSFEAAYQTNQSHFYARVGAYVWWIEGVGL